MKRTLALFALVALLTIGVSAQSPFRGFFTPVTADQFTIGDKALTGQFLIRPEFTIAGPVFKPLYIDGKFAAFETSIVSRMGFGGSYSLYKLVNGEPYNVYSFAAQLSLATQERPNMGILVTASAFDFYGLSPSFGIGYDFVKDSPAKANWFLMFGSNITF
jgi:hypothetical protein